MTCKSHKVIFYSQLNMENISNVSNGKLKQVIFNLMAAIPILKKKKSNGASEG